jgi:hypothetical protein
MVRPARYALGVSSEPVASDPGASKIPDAPNAPNTAMDAQREEQLAKVPFFDGLTAEALAMIAHVTTEE